MRIWLLSDLHVDFCPCPLPQTPPGIDVVVVAGDIGARLVDRSLPWLSKNLVPCGAPVVFTPGNHEFYKTNLAAELPRARILARRLGIHLLAEGEEIAIRGVRFVGATLWTDYRLTGDPVLAQGAALQMMNDHRAIRFGANWGRWLPRHALAAHCAQRAAIDAVLARPFDGPSVVVTHHAPHPDSLPSKGPRDPLDAAYASDLSDLMARRRPVLWAHGHTHQSRDYRVSETRVVSNPRGYAARLRKDERTIVEAENPQHDPSFTVDL